MPLTRRGAVLLPLLARSVLAASGGAASFEENVQPILSQTCTPCHNQSVNSGGLNLEPFLRAESIRANRGGWERIVAQLRAGEMPPRGVPRPSPAKIEALIGAIEGELDQLDRASKPDPGRVVAHRLNRSEYANTIRDLLGVDFRADEEFFPDDSGYGFDNI